LRGITGSGKTEVYKALAMEVATRDKSAIILVPEISLTAQLVSDFQRDFDHVIVTHSGQTEAERFAIWKTALDSTRPTIVIGPRSALFMPLRNLGLIVIDECHEPSYKQEKAPRYNALRAASVLAKDTTSRLILGSATPLIADMYTAQRLKRPIVEMAQLARPGAVKPETTIIDLTRRDAFGRGSQIFTRMLIEEMEKVLHAGRQILLFHNRRGTASVTMCGHCGYTATCPRCFLPLTLHADKFELRCHICGFREKPPTKCPDCGQAAIAHRGIGTKRIEEEVRRLFPDARIKRFDGDSARGEGVHDLYDNLKTGEIDIIIGTQTIAKGLDLPKLALVGIVQADAGLLLPDFSAAERTFQLVAQAAGRVGRGRAKTRVIVQTYQPTAPAIVCGAAQDYQTFYDKEIKSRYRGHFPPFSHLLKLTCAYKTEKGAVNSAKKLASEIRAAVRDGNATILGPTPAFYERQRDQYRWQIVVRAGSRDVLKQIAAYVAETRPAKNWQIELDPNSLL
jgi:primosomal protein N' (replication factor Y)